MMLAETSFVASGAALGSQAAWFYGLDSNVRELLSGRIPVLPSLAAPAGLDEVGTNVVTVPTTGDVEAFINGKDAGTTFWFTPGALYRLPLLGYEVGDVGMIAKNGDKFLTDPANPAILKGSIDLGGDSGWTLLSGAYWKTYSTAVLAVQGTSDPAIACNVFSDSGTPGDDTDDVYWPCLNADDVYIDGVQQLRAPTLAACTAGRYFIDDGANRVYVGTNPAGHTIEIAQVRYAIIGGSGPNTAAGADNVTVEGFEITQFAGTSQFGAITTTQTGYDWTIRYNYIHHNHACGIFYSFGSLIEWNRVEYNGQMGMKGSHNTLGVQTQLGWTVRYNRIVGNKLFEEAGYKNGWEGGGVKWSRTHGVTVKWNYSSGNYGSALWFDVAICHSEMAYNVIEEELKGGSVHDEGSYSDEIHHNMMLRGGSLDTRSATFLWGAGVQVGTSPRSYVHDNTVVKCHAGIGFLQQDRSDIDYRRIEATDALVATVDGTGETLQIEGCFCDDNWVVLDAGQYMGAVKSYTPANDTIFSGGVLFRRNTVYVDDLARYWVRYNSNPVNTYTGAQVEAAFPSYWIDNDFRPLTEWSDNWLPVGLE